MPILHVAITGRDRRHLTALGPKLRVVVVGYKESKGGKGLGLDRPTPDLLDEDVLHVGARVGETPG